MAVTFDAVGPSATGYVNTSTPTASPQTWTHTVASNATALLVWIAADNTASGSPAVSVTAGGVSMVAYSGNPIINGASGQGNSYAFTLLNPPTGVVTISVTISNELQDCITGGSLSFIGAGSFGTPVEVVSGVSGSITLTCTGVAATSMVAGFIGIGDIPVVPTTGTSRFRAQGEGGSGSTNGNSEAATNTGTGNVSVAWTTLPGGDSNCGYAVEVIAAAAGAVAAQDFPQLNPGPFWLQLFKHQLPKPFRLPYSFAGVSSSGSFALAPLHFTAAGNQTSPDVPQINPGPLWLSRFKQWQWKPRPVPPAVQGTGSTGSFALASPAFAAQGSQSSPDIPRFDPGVFWLQLFKPQLPKPWRVTPDAGAPVTLVTATGNLVLAPLAFTANGSQSSPDQPQVNPGTTWLRLFRPDLYKPVPAPPAQGSVNGTGSFSLASVVFQGQGSQTSPDVLQVSPGTTWIRLFRPDLHKPVPVPPAFQAVSGTASFSLAPLHFTATGNQTSPDVPQVQPGTTWLDLFKPWLPKPRPVPPALQSVNGTTAAQTGFALASLKFAASGTVSAAAPPDVPQIAPGPSWLSRFKPWVPKRPRPDAQQFVSAVTESGLFNIWLPGGCVHFGTPKIVIPAPHASLQAFIGNYGPFNITIPSLRTSLVGVHYGSRFNITLPLLVTSLAAKIEGGAFNPVLPPLKMTLAGTTTHVHSGSLNISLGQCFSMGGHFFRRAELQLPPAVPAEYLQGPPKITWNTQPPGRTWNVSSGSVSISHLSVQYVLVPVTASKNGVSYNPGADPVQFAFMPQPTQVPGVSDWASGSWQTEATNVLYPYSARILVGPGTGTVTTLGIGTYQIYVKISDSPETPVLQAGQVVIT